MKYLATIVLSLCAFGLLAQTPLAAKFPSETMNYKPQGKPDCSSMNVAGMPPMNTCAQKYSNGKLSITISLTEYPKGNPVLLVSGNGDDTSITKNEYTIEDINVGKAKGKVTYMKKNHLASVSMQIADKLIIDVTGPNQPDTGAVKALAKALKL
ncbi:hypothetical protein [Emticicia sp. 17c]|uniref:hypothetical protein n=1 Tax=Emticicia sp. 17c TaxID=3127704 RepID=UPI00301D2F1F